MTFKLDTTGAVERGEAYGGQCFWSDLSPFTQGYVEALFSSGVAPQTMWPCRFQDLAPEILARIIADCETLRADLRALRNTNHDGRKVWEVRQMGDYRRFPPLTVALSDVGKVVFQ